MLLSDVCLSVTYIRPNLRTERPRKTDIGTEVAHVTHDSDSTFKVKGELVADFLNSQHARTGATWWINVKILSTCRAWRYIVPPRAQFVLFPVTHGQCVIKPKLHAFPLPCHKLCTSFLLLYCCRQRCTLCERCWVLRQHWVLVSYCCSLLQLSYNFYMCN